MSNSRLWKKVVNEKTTTDNNWYILRQEMEDYMISELGLTTEQVNEFYRVEYALKKELGLVKTKEDEV